MPKANARTLCRGGFLHDGDLVLVAPEYLQPTFWYYCGGRVELHGFVGWDGPILADWKGYVKRWSSPDAIPDAISKASAAIGKTRESRLLLVWHPNLFGPPVYFTKRIRLLQRALAGAFRECETFSPPGRFERVLVTVYRPRSE